ncbi:hypothetical protein DFH08DRAFT_815165 [Mycena albidolilacea]|uniref:Uncharacterized protein n=1 Tax=Mycena albidolilacea TaxID=1033008 RepID=A0AAD6ZNG9_9AGAR|nr:hypothetical protein DFH08DRAFT_815165 [Mycena albidolilacea]
MSFLGGIFARNNPSASKSNSSKTDLSHSSSPSNSHSGTPHLGSPASPHSLSPSNSGLYYGNANGSNAGNSSYAASSQASSPTAEYVSFIAAGPSSPNGRGFVYAGDSPLNNANAKEGRQKDRKDGKKSGGGGLGFFGRKRSRNDLTPPVLSLSPGSNSELDPPPNPGRPSYLSRLSTSSELPPTTANLSPTGSSAQSLRPGYWGTGSPSTRSLPPPSTVHSSSSLAPGGSHTYTGSLLTPSISPTKSTTTAKSAKSAGAKSGRRFAFWARGKGAPESPSPTKRGGGEGKEGKEGGESEFNLRSFRHVSPAAINTSANSPLAGATTSYTNLNSSQTNLMGGSTAKLTASNLFSLELEMDLGSAPRRPRPRGGSDASASSGSRISVAAFREVSRSNSLAPPMKKKTIR